MVGVVDLIRIVIAYGGHILIENSIHFKFWTQPFMSDIKAAVNTKYNGRSFLLNRCRFGGTYFNQFKFYTPFPPHATKHMELTCDHHFKHSPCLCIGLNANGNSVTKASGVYICSMVFNDCGLHGLASSA